MRVLGMRTLPLPMPMPLMLMPLMPMMVRHVRELFVPKAKATGRIYVGCWRQMEKEGGGLAYRVRRARAVLSLIFVGREGGREKGIST